MKENELNLKSSLGDSGVILIADSGSTKTHWCIVENGTILQEILTDGINPFYQTDMEIIALIDSQLIPKLEYSEIEFIYFYGAGCSFPDKKILVSRALVRFFSNAIIEIQSDLLAAARSLFQHEKGIACILGTGSNSCFYNGNEIVQNVSPLGYILGDEGSGAVLGKLFVADCLKNQLPEELREKFLAKYELTPAIILDSVYKKPFPNRFLAKFTPFLSEHIDEPSIFNLIYDSFEAFFVRNVLQYPLEDMNVGFVGSIAYYFRDTLEIVASERGIVISEIVQSPMEGLLKYHTM
ncbi:MAG: ATPase [Paludibacter sp.]|nr:ATPase [Paludibacter sp.]